MCAVVLQPDPAWLAERHRLGQDRLDEVWDGVLHVVPQPGLVHMRFESELEAALRPIAKALGLEVESRDKSPFYARHAVQEIWLVEPRSRSVEVYVLRGDTYFAVAANRAVAIDAPRLGITLETIAGPKLRVASSAGAVEI